MKKTIASIIVLALMVLALPVLAVQITVPSSPTAGYMLTSTTTGQYVATTTTPLNVGAINATSTTVTSMFQQMLANGSTTLQNFTFRNATGTSATTTNFNVTTQTFSGFTAGALYSDSNGQVRTHATTSASVASQDVWRDGNSNIFSSNFIYGVTSTVSNGGTITMNPASNRYQVLSGTQNETYRLPNALSSGMAVGATFDFNNNSTGILTIASQDGTALRTVAYGGFIRAFATDVSTAQGTWEFHDMSSHNSSSGDWYSGVGTTSPYARFAIHANNGDPATTLFAIASSTSNSTTTLFSVNNAGLVNSTNLTVSSNHIIVGSNSGFLNATTSPSFNIASTTLDAMGKSPNIGTTTLLLKNYPESIKLIGFYCTASTTGTALVRFTHDNGNATETGTCTSGSYTLTTVNNTWTSFEAFNVQASSTSGTVNRITVTAVITKTSD